IRKLMIEVGGATAFIRDVMVPHAKAYHLVLTAGDAENPLRADTKSLLIQLHRLSGEFWVPAAMLAVTKALEDPNAGHRALVEIDRLVHVFRLLSVGGKRRSARISAICAALRNGEGFDNPQHSAFEIKREQLRVVSHHLRDLHGRNQQTCKLVLMRLNDELSGKVAAYPPADFSVEHVLPQRPKPTSKWRDDFPDAEHRDACTKSLGNLVLVTPAQNNRAKNEELADKQKVYATPENGRELPKISEAAIETQNWAPETIEKREAELLAMVARLWRIEV
ncbi:MAG: HNH endonuclease family protein, partial [Pseudomonadota bacterium]